MVPPPADVDYKFGPADTGFVLCHTLTEHVEVWQDIPPVHPFGAQISRSAPGK